MKLSLDRPDIEKTPRIYFFDADDSTICGRDDSGEVVHLENILNHTLSWPYLHA